MSHPSNDQTLNPSGNESIREVMAKVDPGRRRFIQGSLGVGALAALGGLPIEGLVKTAYAAPISPSAGFGGIGFEGIPASLAPVFDGVRVPAGYTAKVLIRWGDPISNGPAWNKNATQTAADQEKQFGMHNDGMHFFPFPLRGNSGKWSEHGILCVNNEYTHEGILHPDGLDSSNGGLPGAVVTLEKVRKSQAAHGVSIIEIKKVKGEWTVKRPSAFARRITANTPMRISGPAAGHALLQTAADPTGKLVKGTINNCAHGYTPWGTYLTCEENWNGNFGKNGATTQTPSELRYGVTAAGFNYKWHTVDARFDTNANPNEVHRFGWVVEIDPFNPNSQPVKRTAMGRFKHESAGLAVGANNEVVFYQGDDERNEYIYKFVCAGKFNPTNKAANRDLLDSGTLYVAKFNADGTGVWLPLVHGQNGLTAVNGFADQGEVLVKTRQAADRLGATMMDRPEWTAIHPFTGEVYCTLTNNNRRGTTPESSNSADGTTAAASARPPVDAANPRIDNRYGHIIRWRETGGTPAATTFDWDIFVECGDPLDPDAHHQGNIVGDAYGAPDGLWFDQFGRLWIQTDQVGNGSGDFANIGSNTMSCSDPATGQTRRFLTSPNRCEVTGIINTPDGKTMFVCIQHPGEDATAANPTEFSMWPDMDPTGRPRSSVLVITRNDGGIIGGL